MAGKRWYACNYRYFKDIDTPDKAYWLGFILSDGCVRHDERIRHLKTMDTLQIREYLQISLSDKDSGHIQKFLNCIDSTHPIKRHQVTNGFDSDSQYARVIIEDHDLFNDLVSHGVTPRKTFTKTYPVIPKELDFDFIRGVFDADGCLSSHTNHYGTTDYEFEITSTKELLTDICIKLGISATEKRLKQRFPERNNNCFSFKLCGNAQVERVADLIYSDANMYLDRKYNKYIAMKEYRQSRQS